MPQARLAESGTGPDLQEVGGAAGKLRTLDEGLGIAPSGRKVSAETSRP